MKQIMLQDIKVLFPCLRIDVTLYTRDGDESSNSKVFDTRDLISILQLEYGHLFKEL